MRATSLFVLALALCPPPWAVAQSPREQLNQFIAQLRVSPSYDLKLRERIITLAQEVRPPLAVPEEAERRLGRGQAAFETAKEPADFDKAVAEFRAASEAAPWLAAPYYNLGLAHEKAGRLREAMTNLRLYLLAEPGAADAAAVRQRIFKLEYLAEQPPPPPTDEELLARVNGARFVKANVDMFSDSRGDWIYDVRGREIVWGLFVRELGPNDRQFNPQLLGRYDPRPRMDYLRYKGRLVWEFPREMSCPREVDSPSCFPGTFRVDADGRALTSTWWDWTNRVTRSAVYLRAN